MQADEGGRLSWVGEGGQLRHTSEKPGLCILQMELVSGPRVGSSNTTNKSEGSTSFPFAPLLLYRFFIQLGFILLSYGPVDLGSTFRQGGQRDRRAEQTMQSDRQLCYASHINITSTL